MQKTIFNESFRKVISNEATSYYNAGNNDFRKALLNYSFTGSTGVYSTIAYMLKWLSYLIQLYQQNDPLFQKMILLQKLPSGTDNNYASGFYISKKYKGIFMMYHDGYDAAYSSYMACFPKEKLGIIMLANNSSINPKYYGNAISEMLIEKNIQPDTITSFRKIEEGLATNVSLQKDLPGTYEMEDGFVFEIKEKNGSLNVVLEGEAFRLYPQPNGELSVKPFNYNLLYNANNKKVIVLEQNGEVKKGHKVDLVAPKDLNMYVGKFYSEEVSEAYNIKLLNSKLVVSHLKHGEIEMSQFTRDVFRSGISFFDKIRFERSRKGHIIGFTYLGSRAEGLYFKKVKCL